MPDTCTHDHGHDHHHGHHHDHGGDATQPRVRRVLWAALVINLAMFAVELVGGLGADSVALLADAVDFFGDAASYGISLAVLGMAGSWRARAALFKGWTMALWGAAVLLYTAWNAWAGSAPEPATMGWIGALALVANVAVALMLYAWRDGDANMRSVWLCSRNDAIGNLAVLAAALGVFGSGTAWPDLLVATGMGLLALSAGRSVVRQARQELHAAAAPAPAAAA